MAILSLLKSKSVRLDNNHLITCGLKGIGGGPENIHFFYFDKCDSTIFPLLLKMGFWFYGHLCKKVSTNIGENAFCRKNGQFDMKLSCYRNLQVQ